MIKRENLLLFIGFISMLVLSVIGLAIYQNFIPTNNLDKLFGTKVKLQNTELINDDNAKNIISKSNAVSTGGKNLAVVYEVRVFTTDFGDPQNPYIDLYIGIDENDKVYVTDKFINQTKSFIPLVKDYILRNYAGLYYENVQYVDGAAGGTTIYDSRGSIKGVVLQVIDYHYGADPLAVFKLEAEPNSEVTIDKGIKYTVNYQDEILVIYKVSKYGDFSNGQEIINDSITIWVAVDEAGIVKYVGMPIDDYGHSPGGFYNNVLAALEILVANNVDITSQAFIDFVNTTAAGVTYSTTVVNDLLKVVAEDYNLWKIKIIHYGFF